MLWSSWSCVLKSKAFWEWQSEKWFWKTIKQPEEGFVMLPNFNQLWFLSVVLFLTTTPKIAPWRSWWFVEISVVLIWLALIWLALIWVTQSWLALFWVTLIWLTLIWLALIWLALIWLALIWLTLIWLALIWVAFFVKILTFFTQN